MTELMTEWLFIGLMASLLSFLGAIVLIVVRMAGSKKNQRELDDRA